MKKISEYQGLCPLCYKPIATHEVTKELEISNGKGIYHAECLRNCVQQIAGEHRNKLEKWMTLRLDEWLATGTVMRQMREEMGISIKDMSIALGVSMPRLKRFEKGDPVKDAKLLYNAYILKISAENIYRNYCNYYNHTQGIPEVYHTIEMTHLAGNS